MRAKAISLGAADTPIFWYRPKDAREYRVIYADLSVHEADTPPSVPVALPEKDLIETFRYYSQLSGGPFPDSLDFEECFRTVLKKKFHLENGQKPSAEQMQEIVKSSLKFQPGLAFINQMPPDAGAHYAGKGVKLGTAETPIFWYRPKDSKTYRVIYADLSVQEADTPPDVPNAQAIGKEDRDK